jgi:Protein of Unknown function (DUF2784)
MMSASSAALADAVLIIHALFVGVVVMSVPLIAIGGWRGWRWVRNPVYRFTHLGMIAFVAGESLIGMNCPLTVWESKLRINAGQAGYSNDFIAVWLDRLLFYHLPQWMFLAMYVGFALLVASLFYFVPIKKRGEARGTRGEKENISSPVDPGP